MSDSLVHRGPDDSGVWADAESGIALGHRRLSIIDLSTQGRQPMVSADGRFLLVYNGEIYNHGQLRDDLQKNGCQFRGHSDTEVLLEAVAHWGLPKTLDRLNGMFAFAVWDRRERRLTLVRDRLGIKPLYYGWFGDCFLFGSELKSLRKHPAFRGEIDRNVLALFLENGYIPSPCCIFRNVEKLPPGHLLEISPESTQKTASARKYWSLKEVANNAAHCRPAQNSTEKMAQLSELLTDSVKIRLVADVPLGTFLSGGIDSSLIVAIAQKVASQPVQTFTIGFEEQAYDESRYATAIAERLGAPQVTHVVSAAEAQSVIPQLPAIYDEPFADPSQIPTFLVSKLARERVTVCLSGDGGDELFGGYNRYQHIERIRNKIAWCPRSVRKPIAQLYDLLRNRLVRRKTEPGMAARVASASSDSDLYSILHRHWNDARGVVVDGDASRTDFRPANLWTDLGSFYENMMAYDSQTYLPDDILCKVDRASMAHGLEARVPLLDHRVAEFAWSIPLADKVAQGNGKLPLRNLLAQFVPEEMFVRPKTGFGIPLGEWLRGPLRDWAEDLLDADRLSREGWFRPRSIRDKWNEHLSGQHNWQYLLWNVLMFQAWLQETP